MRNAVKDLGSELKAAREFQGMTLEDVHHVTKISLKFLRAIEKNDLEVLPKVYVRVFLRAYASAVGIEPEKVLDAFDEIAGVQDQEETAPEIEIIESEDNPLDFLTKGLEWFQKNIRVLLYGVGGIVGVIVIGLIIFRSPGDKSSSIPQTETAPAVNSPAKNGINLSVKALENVYLMVSIDGGDSLDYNLIGESSKQFTASDRLWVLTSDAGAMEIRINGEVVQPVSDQGWAAHFIVDKSGLQILKAFPPIAQVR